MPNTMRGMLSLPATNEIWVRVPIRFPLSQPVPVRLIGSVVRCLAKEAARRARAKRARARRE
jgi:hypothetical protein